MYEFIITLILWIACFIVFHGKSNKKTKTLKTLKIIILIVNSVFLFVEFGMGLIYQSSEAALSVEDLNTLNNYYDEEIAKSSLSWFNSRQITLISRYLLWMISLCNIFLGSIKKLSDKLRFILGIAINSIGLLVLYPLRRFVAKKLLIPKHNENNVKVIRDKLFQPEHMKKMNLSKGLWNLLFKIN